MGQLAFSLSASMFTVGLLFWIFKSDTSSKRKVGARASGAADWEVEELSSTSSNKNKRA